MLDVLKSVLDNLNSALSEWKNKITEVDKERAGFNARKIRQDEKDAELIAKARELNERENAVKHIESIVEAAENAKKLTTEANTLMKNANERQALLEAGLKEISKGREKLDKDRADFQVENTKQIEALNEERKAFNAKVTATKAMAAALK